MCRADCGYRGVRIDHEACCWSGSELDRRREVAEAHAGDTYAGTSASWSARWTKARDRRRSGCVAVSIPVPDAGYELAVEWERAARRGHKSESKQSHDRDHRGKLLRGGFIQEFLPGTSQSSTGTYAPRRCCDATSTSL